MKLKSMLGGTAALTAALLVMAGALPAAADDALTEPPPAPVEEVAAEPVAEPAPEPVPAPVVEAPAPPAEPVTVPEPVVEPAPAVKQAVAPVEQAVAEVQQQTIEYDTPKPDDKWVFVCKYTGKPGVDEVLQSGNNPISVSVNSIKGNFENGEVVIGSFFADGQFRSFVLAFDPEKGDGQHNEPPITDCPPPDGVDLDAKAKVHVKPPTCEKPGSASLSLSYAHVVGEFATGPGMHEVTIEADAGHAFMNGKTTVTLSYTILPKITDPYECPPDVKKDATAKVTVTEPTCEADGSAKIKLVNATVTSDFPQTPGTHTVVVTADDGHAFPNGETTLSIEYTIEDALPPDSDECAEKVPLPALFAADPVPPTCDADGDLPSLEELAAEFPNVTLAFDRSFDGPGTYVLTVTPDPGYFFNPENVDPPWTLNPDGSASRDIVVEAAIGFQNEDPEAPCFFEVPVVVTLAPPTIVDECGVANDAVILPEDTEGVTYFFADEADPTNFDIRAEVAAGFVVEVVPDGWVDSGEGFFDYAVTDPFTDIDCELIPGAIQSQCVGSVPYLAYAVTLPEGEPDPGPNPLTITFVHPTDPSQDYTVGGLPLSGTALWPGASVSPQNWPGWVLNPDGTYSETTGNFAWTRDPAGVTVLFEVNPTFETTVTYPPESAVCANPPAPPSTPTGNPPTPITLASTGFDPAVPFWAALATLLVGAGALGLNGLRRHRGANRRRCVTGRAGPKLGTLGSRPARPCWSAVRKTRPRPTPHRIRMAADLDTGTSAGRFGSTPSPALRPRSRRMTHGAAWRRIHSRSPTARSSATSSAACTARSSAPSSCACGTPSTRAAA